MIETPLTPSMGTFDEQSKQRNEDVTTIFQGLERHFVHVHYDTLVAQGQAECFFCHGSQRADDWTSASHAYNCVCTHHYTDAASYLKQIRRTARVILVTLPGFRRTGNAEAISAARRLYATYGWPIDEPMRRSAEVDAREMARASRGSGIEVSE